MTLEGVDPEGGALTDPGGSAGITPPETADEHHDVDAATFGLLLLAGGDGSKISDNKEISQELLLVEEGCAGENPKSGNSSTEKDHAAASPESTNNRASFSHRNDASSIASTGTTSTASPALCAILASQRSDRDRDISMLSPQPISRSRFAPNSDPSSNSTMAQHHLPNKRTSCSSPLFSPTPNKHNMESPNIDGANRSTSSLESIGKISDRDLLSPILQSGNGENMRFSIGEFSHDGVNEQAVFARGSDTSSASPKDAEPGGTTMLNGGMQNTIASSDLPGSAKRVLLRLEDVAGDGVAIAEDDEVDAPPEAVSTPKRSVTESLLDVQVSLRSPFPTIFEADDEEETESEPSTNRETVNESTELPPNLSPSVGVTTGERAESLAESSHLEAAQTTGENWVDLAPSSPFDTSLSPLQSIRSVETRRSLNLIERLRRNSFRRRMSVSEPDGAGLSLPAVEDNPYDSEKTTFVPADDAHVDSKASLAVDARNLSNAEEIAFLPSTSLEQESFNGNADEFAGTLASQDSLLAADFSNAVDVKDALAGRSEEAQVQLHLGVDSARQDEDAASTRHGLGASSMTFIEHLRGAALRRKMNLSRSRDSLAAKERKQRQDIAASDAARLQHEEQVRQAAEALERRDRSQSVADILPTRTFKARPMPPTCGHLGSGGLSGVPKVAKKLTTTPMSPFLGPRRKMRKQEDTLTATPFPEPSKEAKDVFAADQNQFKARPLPKTTGAFGCAGQAGVPKVPKRQATVPFSPLLGPRRKTTEQLVDKAVRNSDRPMLDNIGVGQVHRLSSASQASLSSGQSLLGLEICNQKENDYVQVGAAVSPQHADITAFVPRSTARAEKRALFEAERILKEQQRKEQQQRERNEKLKALRKELKELRMSI